MLKNVWTKLFGLYNKKRSQKETRTTCVQKGNERREKHHQAENKKQKAAKKTTTRLNITERHEESTQKPNKREGAKWHLGLCMCETTV